MQVSMLLYAEFQIKFQSYFVTALTQVPNGVQVTVIVKLKLVSQCRVQSILIYMPTCKGRYVSSDSCRSGTCTSRTETTFHSQSYLLDSLGCSNHSGNAG